MCTTITIPTLTDGVLPRLFHDSQPPPLLRTENVRSQGDSSANQNDVSCLLNCEYGQLFIGSSPRFPVLGALWLRNDPP